MIDLAEITDLVRHSALPVALIDLERFAVVAVSPAGAERLGVSADQAEAVDLRTVIRDPAAAREELEMIRMGKLSSYEAHGELKQDGQFAPVLVSVRGIETTPPITHAFVLYVDPTLPTSRYVDEAESLLGTVDASGTIRHISADTLRLLRTAVAGCLGHALVDYVHPDDAARLLRALDVASRHGIKVEVDIRMGPRDGSWQQYALMVTPLDRGMVGFAAVPAATSIEPQASVDRIAALEHHLSRIAQEVDAAHVLPESNRVLSNDAPPVALTARQWQVLDRILRGERVSTIAQAMFLSQSTIRNYLSAIFRAFGVHSQAELIERLRAARSPASAQVDIRE